MFSNALSCSFFNQACISGALVNGKRQDFLCVVEGAHGFSTNRKLGVDGFSANRKLEFRSQGQCSRLSSVPSCFSRWRKACERRNWNRGFLFITRAGDGVGGDTLWVTAVSAVGLTISLAAAAGFGGFLLSKAMENEALAESAEIEKLKEQGLWKELGPEDLENQAVNSRSKKRPVREE